MERERGRIGRYELRSRLATGGMAEVFVASLPVSGTDKLVVIKRPYPEVCETAEARTMMLDEARIGLRLRHQNIARMLDAGMHGELPFVALEYVQGVDLYRFEADRRRSQQVIPVDVVAYIGAEVLSALHYAHRACGDDGRPLGIVHRDVSPHNVLLSVDGEVKLTDFGIALARDRTHRTRDGATKGKLAYMAPEQLHAGVVDARTDLFAVAATLYEALCGTPPFAGDGELDSIGKLERGVFEPIRQHRADVPLALAAIIEAALAHDRESRPACARAMQVVFDELVGNRRAAIVAVARAVRSALGQERARRAADDALERGLLGAIDAPTPVPRTAPSATRRIRAGTPERPRGRWRRWVAVAAVAAGAAAAGIAVAHHRSPPVVKAGHPAAVATVSVAPPPVAAPLVEPPAIEPPPPPSATVSVAPPPTRASEEVRPRPRPSRPGSVTVTSIPWARVSIDGRYVGDTPVTVKLAPGPHRIRLHNPQLERTRTTKVVVKEGRVSAVRMEL